LIEKGLRLKESSPEKAGVGGSTPSLATIIPKTLAKSWRQEAGKITHVDNPRLHEVKDRYEERGNRCR
jgi:hypothetical protein